MGTFLPNESRTYTEVEYDTALKANKNIFMFRLKTFDDAIIDNKVKHDELLKKFEGKPSHEFENIGDFEKGILRVLSQY